MNSRKAWMPFLLIVSVSLGLGSCAGFTTGQSATETVVPETESATQSPSELVEVAEVEPSSANDLYQELLSQYGENCLECLEPLEYELRSTPPDLPGQSEAQNDRQLNVLIALDSSGSMAEAIGEGIKIDIARSAITNFTNTLPDAANVGLLVYGHKGSSDAADQAVSCQGIELSYPIEPFDRDRFSAAVNSFQPTGYTPIAATLNRAEEIFSRFDNTTNQNIVYVVSDGIETCDGDPVEAARALHQSNAQVIVNVIGFDVDNEAQRQLQAVADAGGGDYIPARDANELNDALSQTRLRRYILANNTDRTRVNLATATHLTELRLCVSTKLTKEKLAFTNALGRLIRERSPDAQHREAVLAQLNQRHDTIQSWLDQLETDIENQRDLTLDQLEQDLERVTNSTR
jgi:Ca-activated chloride channel homolog